MIKKIFLTPGKEWLQFMECSISLLCFPSVIRSYLLNWTPNDKFETGAKIFLKSMQT